MDDVLAYKKLRNDIAEGDFKTKLVCHIKSYARSKYRARSQLVTTSSNLRCSVRKKWR